MKQKKTFATLLGVAFATTTLAACGSANDESGGGSESVQAGESDAPKLCEGSKPITIGMIQWDEDVAVTHLWKKVLEERGCTVKISEQADAGPTYVGMSKNQINVYLDSWLPQTHADYWKKYKKDYVDLGTWNSNAKLTMAVPKYMKDVNSIADVKKVAGKVDNKIVGIEPGAGLTKATNKAIKDYGLGVKQTTSTTAAMLAALKRATDKKEPIVVALWRPHWAYAEYPVKDLKDPKGSLGKAENIKTIANKNFPKDFPKVAALMKKFKMTDSELAGLTTQVRVKHKDDPDAGVNAWLKENPDFVKKVMS